MKPAAPPRGLRASGSRRAGQTGFVTLRLLAFLLVLGAFGALTAVALVTTRGESHDERAKAILRSAARALEIYRTDHGTYGATPARLAAVDDSLADARGLTVRGGYDSYTVSVDSAAGDRGGGTFTLSRDAAARIVRDCTHPGHGACRSVVDGAGNRW
jgi:type II secretory pathway pseudopilin PulG